MTDQTFTFSTTKYSECWLWLELRLQRRPVSGVFSFSFYMAQAHQLCEAWAAQVQIELWPEQTLPSVTLILETSFHHFCWQKYVIGKAGQFLQLEFCNSIGEPLIIQPLCREHVQTQNFWKKHQNALSSLIIKLFFVFPHTQTSQQHENMYPKVKYLPLALVLSDHFYTWVRSLNLTFLLELKLNLTFLLPFILLKFYYKGRQGGCIAQYIETPFVPCEWKMKLFKFFPQKKKNESSRPIETIDYSVSRVKAHRAYLQSHQKDFLFFY